MYASSTTKGIVLNTRCRCSGLCSQDATRYLSKGSAQPPYLGCDLESYDDVIRVSVASVECTGARKRAQSVGPKGSVDFLFIIFMITGIDYGCCRWLGAGYESG